MRFLLKALPATIIVVAIVTYLGNRFTIGIDPQRTVCLGYRIFIIDHHDQAPQQGKPFQFSAKHMAPFFHDGTPIVKIMAGVPGDRITVREDGVLINGQAAGNGLDLAEIIGKPATRFLRDEFLGMNKYWFMGKTRDSFDSRYWGTVDTDQIVGRAYPLW